MERERDFFHLCSGNQVLLLFVYRGPWLCWARCSVAFLCCSDQGYSCCTAEIRVWGSRRPCRRRLSHGLPYCELGSAAGLAALAAYGIYGIFLDQGSRLHWQVVSSPRSAHGSPEIRYILTEDARNSSDLCIVTMLFPFQRMCHSQGKLLRTKRMRKR